MALDPVRLGFGLELGLGLGILDDGGLGSGLYGFDKRDLDNCCGNDLGHRNCNKLAWLGMQGRRVVQRG